MRDHPAATSPDLIVGTATADDAGVYRVAPELALVQTIDFFTPVVDDAYDWGRITAANALSDIYAMGASPLTALQLIGWPRDTIEWSVAAEVIRGGSDVMADAGCVIVGGHSIDDAEPTYGFAVTGTVHPDRVVTNRGGQPGDALILTKPLGIGIVTTAIKRDRCPPELASKAIEQMATTNAAAAVGLRVPGVHAATDVTGFGLLGHLAEMLAGGHISAHVDVETVPVLDGAWDLLHAGCWPGGSERNRDAVAGMVDGDADEDVVRMLSDAQTSGGLLVAASHPDSVLDAMEGVDAVVIGRLVEGGGRVTLG